MPEQTEPDTPGASTGNDTTTDHDQTRAPDQTGDQDSSAQPSQQIDTTAGQASGRSAPDDTGSPNDGPPSSPESRDTAGSGEVSALPQWAQKVIRDTRNEAASNRTKARDAETRHQQMLDAIATALGLKGEDEGEKDPAKLTERLTASQAEAHRLKVERAIDRAARKQGADEELLTAWLAHTGKLSGLDPAAEDFASQVDTLVAETVQAHPKLKAGSMQPPPARSGGEFTGGSGDQPADTGSLSIDEHRTRRRKRREIDSTP